MSKIKMSNITMDHINAWLVALHEDIELDMDLTPEQQEELDAIIYGNISEQLERYFKYPGYGNYN